MIHQLNPLNGTRLGMRSHKINLIILRVGEFGKNRKLCDFKSRPIFILLKHRI